MISSADTGSRLIARPADAGYTRPTRLAILGAVGRRLGPQLVEATLIPTALFYATYTLFGVVMAYAAALAWSYVALGRRWATGRAVPTIMLVSGIGITLRTTIALLSGSTFVYFVQPILGTLVLSAVFLGSVAVGRPMIGRFAQDYCALPADVSARPGIVRLYRRLTMLWAVLNLGAAAVAMVLLLTLPVGAFVPVKWAAGWLITTVGVVVTVSASVRTAQRENLVAAVAANGALTARCRFHPERHEAA